jgi:hypothetical protein
MFVVMQLAGGLLALLGARLWYPGLDAEQIVVPHESEAG